MFNTQTETVNVGLTWMLNKCNTLLAVFFPIDSVLIMGKGMLEGLLYSIIHNALLSRKGSQQCTY